MMLFALRSPAWGRWPICVLLFSLMAVCSQAQGQEAEGAAALEFRRLYVPRKQQKNWPLDPSVRYGPMPKADFERLVELLRNSPPDANTTLAARVGQAHYRVQLTADSDLSGQAILEIERPQSRATLLSQTEDPGALLPLAPCNLAIRGAHWPEDPPEDALCGLDAQAQWSVLVRRAGSLILDWTLRGAREPSGGWRYNFELPPAPSSTLTLDLPVQLAVKASRGIVVQAMEPRDSLRRWQLTLGGQNHFWILVTPQDESRRGERGAVLRQVNTYSVNPRGLELTTQLTLDVAQEPLRQLELTLEPGLRLLAARQGETHVPWSIIDDASSASSRVVLEFAEPLQGLGNVILLGATAALKVDEPWRLPAIHAPGIFWQEGRATVLVRKPLSLERLNLTDCRQSNVGPLPPPDSGESISLQYFQPAAAAEVVLAHGQQRLHVSTGTAIELLEDAIQGRVTAALTVNEGQLFSLQAAVPHRWNIDDVVSEPAGRIRDWSLDTPTPRKRVLDVRLSKALSPAAPLRLVISGHRLNVAAGELLPAEELRLIHFNDAETGEDAVAVNCPESHQLQLSGGEEIKRYDMQKLSPAVAALFSAPPRGLIFQFDPRATRLALTMQRLAPRYSADLRVTASVTAGPLLESYEIHCRPQGSRVERLFVYFSQARVEAPVWKLQGESAEPLSARRLTDEQMLAQCGRETGEMWELSLGQSSSAAFLIRASRTVALGEDTPLSLIWLPGAESQEGLLQVRCPTDAAVHVRSSRLRPTPLEPPAADRLVRAQFRYSPALDTAAVEPAPISLSRDEQALAQSPAVAWLATLESRYEPTGLAHHSAAWFLEHAGQGYMSLKLPAGIQLDDVWVDEDQIVPRLAGDTLTVPLSGGRRYPTVTLHFRTREPPLGELREFTAPFPTSSLPVVSSDWTLWLPPGYGLAVRDGVWRQANRTGLSLMERVFGPLARIGSPRFEPLESEAWRRLADRPWDEEHAQQAVDGFLDKLGSAPPGTWGPMLLQVQPALELGQTTVLLDRQSLWKAGISPASVSGGAEAETPRRRGLSRLEAARLCLLVHENTLLLTTPLAAAAFSKELAPLDHAALLRVMPGFLGQSLHQAVEQQGNSRYCLISQWTAEPMAPWRVSREQASEAIDTPGWGVFHLTGPAAATPRVEIVRQSTIQVFAWGLFLFIAVLCFRRFARPGRLVVLAVFAASAALLVPELYCPIFSSAFLAFLAALAWQIAAPPRPHAARSTSSSISYKLSDSVHTVATGSLLLLMALAAARAWAADDVPAPDALTPRPRVHKVLIPVDDDQQPDGDLYWVPEELYTQMERRAARLALEPQGWLLERADYRGTLAWDLAQQKLLVSELRARLDLTVFESSRRVKLPLGREGFTLSPPGMILIDGLETPAQWEDEGRLLCFDAVQPGQYRIELLMRPLVNAYADQSGFDLAVPALPTARLELQLPRSAPTVEVPTSVGPVTLADEGRRIIAQLGKASRLSVRWREGAAPGAIRTTIDADQLVWLKVQPGSVVADTRWKFKVLEGSVRQLQLAIDPRFQLQAPLEARNPLVAQSRLVAGNPLLLQIELARPVTDQFTLDAAFRWSGVSGIGNVRAPYVEAQQVRTLRKLLAVSLDPVVEYQESASEGLLSLPAGDFMQQWGTPDAPPQLAYRQSGDASRWSLAVRPKSVRRSVDSVLAVSLSAGRSTWRYDATVQVSGSCFEHRLQVPPTLNIDQIDVREDGVSRLSHWSRDKDGLITLFLAEPASGPQLVELHGWTPVAQRPWRLSSVRFEEADARSALVRIYRHPSVAVEVRNRTGLSEQADLKRQLESQLFEADRRYVGMGRLVSLMQAETPAYAATLLVSANQPKFDCRQTTLLKRESGDWQAELECRIKVRSGLVDALYFDIPPAWRPPFVVTPAADYEVIQTGEGTRQLVIRPATALANEADLHVRGTIATPAGSRLQVPAIALLFAEHLERALVVPAQIDLQTVTWETRGLSRIETPPPAALSIGLSDPQAFLVVDEAFSATLQPAARTPGQPQVALADISLSWHSEGNVQGVAVFDLEPSGNRECPLRLPVGYRLIQAHVNGVPALAVAEGNQQWRLWLSSIELPQHIEVVFAGELPPAAWGRQRLLAPVLGDLPVDRTLWTLRGPRGSKLVKVLEPRRISSWRQHQFRLQSIVKMQRLAAGLSSEETSADLAAWNEPWARRYRQYRGDAERELLQVREPESASSLLAELRAGDQEAASLTHELNGDAAVVRATSSDLVADQPGQIWRFAFDAPQQPMRAMFASRSAEIEVALGNTLWGEGPWRLLAAIGIAAMAAVVLLLARSTWWPAWQRWRYLVAAAIGVAWWLWLAPSILGWLIIILSGLAAWRDRPAAREAGSAIVRLGTGSR